MVRYACIAGLLIVMLPGPSFAAPTAKQKMETCKFGADDQKLEGAARNSFLKKCMAKADAPEKKPAAKPASKPAAAPAPKPAG